MKNTFVHSLIIFSCFLSLNSCKKDKHEKILKELYKTYENGVISECSYNGETGYSAGLNAYDAGSAVYDEDGNQIGSCNFAWGSVDSICNQLEDCEVVYRIEDNIWGQPAVDKYGIGD